MSDSDKTFAVDLKGFQKDLWEKVILKIPFDDFCLNPDVYGRLEPLEDHLKDKVDPHAMIRGTIQILRDKGYIRFLDGRGNYKRLNAFSVSDFNECYEAASPGEIRSIQKGLMTGDRDATFREIRKIKSKVIVEKSQPPEPDAVSCAKTTAPKQVRNTKLRIRLTTPVSPG